MKYLTGLVFSSALVLSCSTASFAAGIEGNPHFSLDERSGVVKYSDLNLANSSDAQILLHRIESLATKLCKRPGDIRQLKAVRDQKRCVEESYRNTIVAINRKTGLDTEGLAAGATGSRAIVGAD